MYALATINPGMSAWGPMVSNADAQVRKYSAQSPAQGVLVTRPVHQGLAQQPTVHLEP
jgi:hypothetical protein